MRGKSAQLIEFDNTTAASIPSCSYADEGRKPCLTRGKKREREKSAFCISICTFVLSLALGA
jgi:hypothetical protein